MDGIQERSKKKALQGLVGLHQQLLLQSQLRHLDFLDGEIGGMDDEIIRRMGPFEEALEATRCSPYS